MCGLLVLLLRPLLGGLPRLVDELFAGAPRAELAVTMVLFPLALNLAQAWVQDTHLKATRDGAGGTPRHGRSGSRASMPGAPFGGLEAVQEEGHAGDGGSRLSGSANGEPGAKAADGAAPGDDREALLPPYRGDS